MSRFKEFLNEEYKSKGSIEDLDRKFSALFSAYKEFISEANVWKITDTDIGTALNKMHSQIVKMRKNMEKK